MRGKHAIELSREIVVSADIHHHFLGVEKPVDIALNFATNHLLGSLLTPQLTHDLKCRLHYADVRVMLVRRVVCVDDLGLRCT